MNNNLAISATQYGTTDTAQMNERYAIYFAPADDSALGLFGASVLRRKAESADTWLNPDLPYNFDNTDLWLQCIKKPARYGFHATIKAPFELSATHSAEQLLDDVEKFCKQQTSIPLENLAPRRTRRFDALAFDQQPEAVHHFANQCVEHFEPYRGALTEADLKRRHHDSLTHEQQQYLDQFGYPYVLNQFNFHMTLSGTMPDDDNGYLQWLSTIYPVMVTETPVLDRLSVFHQPDRNTPFVRIAEFPFS